MLSLEPTDIYLPNLIIYEPILLLDRKSIQLDRQIEKLLLCESMILLRPT